MKLKHLFFAMLLLLSAGLAACGSSGGEGLNGGLTVTAAATGSVINATATYSHPSETNLIGVPISFSYEVGGQLIGLGEHKTNNSGAVSVAFRPDGFNGSQTITVIARTGNLANFQSLTMAGRALTVTAPPNLSLNTSAAGGTVVPFVIPPTTSFVTVTDPFNNDVSSHPINIAATVVSTNTQDTLAPPSLASTGTGGVAPFPGASGTLVAPATVGGIETMTITWIITDVITGQTGSAITTITLTKTS